MPDLAKKQHSLIAVLLVLGVLPPLSGARALPAFARQTGLECADCHTAFPELTPVGRRFKLTGYTKTGDEEISFLDHLAGMVEATYTHTEAGQAGGAAPHFGPNNNLVVQQSSVFYGGKVLDNLGAFVQATYDDVSKRLGWDNTDIRYADHGNVFGYGLVWGISANNNPTVQDVWNTTPAWSFPYISSELAPTPGAATLIEGGFAQQVAGVSLYGFLDDWIYAEFGFYHDLSKRTLTTFGADSTGVNGIDGLAPYWRVALEPHWGRHWLEVGTFGLAADVVPARIAGFGTDSITDTGIDLQYQYMGGPGIVSVRASWIRETRDLGASFAQGLADNRHGSLESFNASATYTWKQTITGTVGRFQTNGNSDLTLNGTPTGSPNSNGWTFEVAYLPFMHGGPSFWPWLNARIGIQYAIYDKFDGSRANLNGNGRFASDNNTLFTYVWIAF